jgi:SpoVK/Ycf46/Vps4 family AAA+-type ATPase
VKLKNTESTEPYSKFENRIDIVRPSISFEDIGGLDEIKGKMKNIATCIKESVHSQKDEVGNILLYGPHGNGKTSLACAVAKECGAGLIIFEDPQQYNCTAWGGPSWCDVISASFSKACKDKPCIILFEDFDNLVEGSTRVKLQLLKEFEEKHGGVVVIAETKKIELIDDEIFYKFNHKFEVKLPNRAEREEIIRIHLERVSYKIENEEQIVELLANETEEFSGRMIAETIDGAVHNLIRDLYYYRIEGNVETANRNNFEEALNEMWRSKMMKG